ncbi:hypothetical protein GCM10022255_090880 [Dactylosporangium darangshiense]|uniref:Uncharacterized protein n=1 Tax=Dactylosporangium darangshiense TaxID=579108 RepID=A0ABP8DPJ6_9ACTN
MDDDAGLCGAGQSDDSDCEDEAGEDDTGAVDVHGGTSLCGGFPLPPMLAADGGSPPEQAMLIPRAALLSGG